MLISDLEGKKVILRPITMGDTPLIVKWRSLPSVNMYLYTREPLTAEQHEYWMEHYVLTGQCAQFIIIDRSDNKPVGSVFIKHIDHQSMKGEYGIFIGEESARGRGLGSEAAKLILDYGFHILGLNRIYLTVFAFNQTAIKSYQCAGFEIEGTMRDDFCWNGKFEDVVIMAALREEWEQRVL